jgi:hypothetical protein
MMYAHLLESELSWAKDENRYAENVAVRTATLSVVPRLVKVQGEKSCACR